MSLLSELRNWRNNQARIEGVEGYRVLSNTVLEALVGALPQTRDDMLAIKGIKDAKFSKYGATLLRMIAEQSGSTGVKKNLEAKPLSERKESRIKNQELETEQNFFGTEIESIDFENEEQALVDQTLTVSQFLDGLNIELSGMAGRIRGEVSSVDVRERVVYFTIKDSDDESTLSCLIFRNQYALSGVDLAIGDEIIVEGSPDIYKPNGRLSLRVGMIELCGEGALKKAYDVLKQKLETEGVFALEKKRLLPQFPERIALITSEQGAAIGDFTMNLGSQGFKVDFYPTSVEGKKAVVDILEALRYFNRHAEKYDVLVVIRGGGSLESLQAFNNETLIREIAECKIPTLLGVGHEKDVTLSALAADVMVSTPTATAQTLRESWDEARGIFRHFKQQLPVLFERELAEAKNSLALGSGSLLEQLNVFLDQAERYKSALLERFFQLQNIVKQQSVSIVEAQKLLSRNFLDAVTEVKKQLLYREELLRQYDPKRVLQLGYSLVRRGDVVVKGIDRLKLGDRIEVQFDRGKVEAKVEKIIEQE